MVRGAADKPPKIQSFEFPPDRVLGGRYVVNAFLGSGWEGEVYAVTERATGVRRALKIFYPERNPNDQSLRFYARKLDRLKQCPILIQYHHSGTMRFHGVACSYLVSELVEGELLEGFIRRQPGRRLPPVEALYLIHALTAGLEQIHNAGDYHGDIHDGNIMVKRRGVLFDMKLVDFYPQGRASRRMMEEDVIQLVRVLYDAVGGRRHYGRQPRQIKEICLGLRRDLIARKFPSAGHLRRHLESFSWD